MFKKMKKLLLSVLALIAISSTTFAQLTDPSDMMDGGSYILDENGKLVETTAPIINFEVESHDFGTVQQTLKVEDRITYDFKFTNDGKEPLILTNVKGSCGCTVPEWPKEPIMPGEESMIHVTYDSKRLGPFNKSITVTSNAYTPTKRLMIRGKVLNAEKFESEEAKENTTPVKKPSMMTGGSK